MVKYIPCCTAPAVHWGLLPATRLASREILIEQNIKKRTGSALWLLCGLAGADLIFQWIGMVEYIPCCTAPAVLWGLLLPASRLASRNILIEQNIKKRTGPALCVLCDV
jgi:hypothetical protein